MGYSNFSFLKESEPEIWRHVSEAERSCYTDFERCGLEVRRALEQFVNQILAQKDINAKFNVYCRSNGWKVQTTTLDNKIQFQSDCSLIPEIGLIDGSPLGFTFDADAGFKVKGKGRKQKNRKPAAFPPGWLKFMRQYGNECAHVGADGKSYKINYCNSLGCLYGCHKLFSLYYGDSQEFDAGRIPIADYYIDAADREPEDGADSGCLCEFMAHKEENGRVTEYALIRLYDRGSVDGNLLMRNRICFLDASDESAGTPAGMAPITEIVPYVADERKSTFYIIAYGFRHEACQLDNVFLALPDFGIRERLQFCAKIAGCFSYLHSLENPISHRLLDYRCIYVSRYKVKGKFVYEPYLVKLDFAKLTKKTEDGNDANETVLQFASAAAGKRPDKYRAPEWEMLAGQDNPDWRTVDIYSLGVLFFDILSGRINKGINSDALWELVDDGVPEKALEMIEEMVAESPEDRPNTAEVAQEFNVLAG